MENISSGGESDSSSESEFKTIEPKRRKRTPKGVKKSKELKTNVPSYKHSNGKMSDETLTKLKIKSLISIYKTVPKIFLVLSLSKVKNKKLFKISSMFNTQSIPDSTVDRTHFFKVASKVNYYCITPKEKFIITVSIDIKTIIRLFSVKYNGRLIIKEVLKFDDSANSGIKPSFSNDRHYIAIINENRSIKTLTCYHISFDEDSDEKEKFKIDTAFVIPIYTKSSIRQLNFTYDDKYLSYHSETDITFISLNDEIKNSEKYGSLDEDGADIIEKCQFTNTFTYIQNLTSRRLISTVSFSTYSNLIGIVDRYKDCSLIKYTEQSIDKLSFQVIYNINFTEKLLNSWMNSTSYFSTSGSYVALAYGCRVNIHNLTNGHKLVSLTVDKNIESIVFSHNESELRVFYDRGSLVVFNIDPLSHLFGTKIGMYDEDEDSKKSFQNYYISSRSLSCKSLYYSGRDYSSGRRKVTKDSKILLYF